MVHLVLVFFLLFLPLSADAAYKIYLKNGSILSGVSSYDKKGGEVTVYFGGGSIGIQESDILRIEDTDAPERDFRAPETAGQPETAPPATPPVQERTDKDTRVSALKAELETVDSEIKSVEAEEARVIEQINERKSARISYNTMQLRQLETDLQPLQQELMSLNQKKGTLLQRKATIEGNLRGAQ